MEPYVDARDPVFEAGDEYTSTPRSAGYKSQKELARQKLNHNTPLKQSVLSHQDSSGLEQEVTSLRSLVAQLQDSIVEMKKSENQMEPPPQPQRPPMPIPLKWEEREGIVKENAARLDPRPSGTMTTSHAEFVKLKRRHAAGIRQSPGRREQQESTFTPVPKTPVAKSALKKTRSPSPLRMVTDTYSRASEKRPCAPQVSHADFSRSKKGHLIDVDSPARRRASEIVTPQPPYLSVVSHMSPEAGKRRPTWPDHLPHNALNLIQGKWVSNTLPPRSFEIQGEALYVEGVESKHKVRLGSFGLSIADITAVALNSHMIEWNDGDTWERPGRRSPVFRHPRATSPAAREPAQRYHQDPMTSRSPTQEPEDMRHEASHFVKEVPQISMRDREPSPRDQMYSRDASPNDEPKRTYGSNSPGYPPVLYEESEDERYCADCVGHLEDCPFCPVTGKPHIMPSSHVTKGRCPSGHRLTIQSEKLGSVRCSSCSLILEASRFAGCRTCDYDVCDVCLGCSEEPVIVTVTRSPFEGTGAICGQSMLLEEVVPGSSAELMGMTELLGKRLTHVNGTAVESITEACDAAQDAEEVEMRFV